MTFSLHYAFTENYILAYSHDEVVHGKKSMIDKMFGEYWQKFASLRTLYLFMFAHPGKKLMFMGDEFAQFIEWDYQKQLDWFLLEYDSHLGMQRFVRKLNNIYASHPALYEVEDSWDGFQWLNVEDAENSVFAFMRMNQEEAIVCVVNFTPVARKDYWIAMPEQGVLELLLSSDDSEYGGEGNRVKKKVTTQHKGINGMEYSASLEIPPLSGVYYKFTLNNKGSSEDD